MQNYLDIKAGYRLNDSIYEHDSIDYKMDRNLRVKNLSITKQEYPYTSKAATRYYMAPGEKYNRYGDNNVLSRLSRELSGSNLSQ